LPEGCGNDMECQKLEEEMDKINQTVARKRRNSTRLFIAAGIIFIIGAHPIFLAILKLLAGPDLSVLYFVLIGLAIIGIGLAVVYIQNGNKKSIAELEEKRRVLRKDLIKIRDEMAKGDK